MKNDLFKTVRLSLEVIGVVLMILLTIGFFNTPFDNGKAQLLTKESVKEQDYVEKMIANIQSFTELSTIIKDTNEQSNDGKIVPMKMSQIYSENYKKLSDQYNTLSVIEVPERFKQFHVSFLKTMEYQGSAINEVLLYLQDKDTTHLKSVDNFNDLFIKKYNETINLFNNLNKEKN